MTDLIEKLEAAEGGSYELDREIGFLIGGWSKVHLFGEWMIKSPAGDIHPDSENTLYEDTYTTSLDRAVSLVERVLPGWFWRAGHGTEQPGWAHLNRVQASACNPQDEATGYAATPALAICVALLHALRDKNNG